MFKHKKIILLCSALLIVLAAVGATAWRASADYGYTQFTYGQIKYIYAGRDNPTIDHLCAPYIWDWAIRGGVDRSGNAFYCAVPTINIMNYCHDTPTSAETAECANYANGIAVCEGLDTPPPYDMRTGPPETQLNCVRQYTNTISTLQGCYSEAAEFGNTGANQCLQYVENLENVLKSCTNSSDTLCASKLASTQDPGGKK